mgnify:CR=1 FL=1
MWLKRKEEEEEKRINQRLNYIDFKPEKDDKDDNNRFEKLESLIKQVNIWLSVHVNGMADAQVERLKFEGFGLI